MHADLIRKADVRLEQELLHLSTLVTLELNDIAVVLMVDDRSVAVQLLFESPRYLLEVIAGRKPLDGCYELASIPLLASDVDQVRGRRTTLLSMFIGEGGRGTEILDLDRH